MVFHVSLWHVRNCRFIIIIITIIIIIIIIIKRHCVSKLLECVNVQLVIGYDMCMNVTELQLFCNRVPAIILDNC